MILGIGVDITKISRFKNLYKNDKFLQRVLTVAELKTFNLLNDEKKCNFLAKRWAGKEAFSKALGCGIGGTFEDIILKFSSIEILKQESGKPFINILDNNLKQKPLKTFISYSDEEDIIYCNVLIEKSSLLL